MVAGYESISSPDHETLGLLEPPEDQSVVAVQKPPRLSFAEQEIGAIIQIIDENRDGLISKEELIAVHHEFQTNGDGRLPAQETGGCLPQGVGAVGSGVAGSQLQASTVVPLPEVICCDTGGIEKQNAESNVETMVAKVGGVGGSSAEDGAATAVVGYSFDGAGVKDNVDGAAPAVNGAGAKDNGDGAAPAVGGDSFDGAGAKGNGDGAAIVAVHHEFHANGDGRLPAQEPGGCLPQGVGAVGSGVAGSQLQASTAVPLPEVISCDTGGTEKQNAESNVETMVAIVGYGGSSAEDGNAAAVVGYSFDGAGVKDNVDGAATAVGGDSFDSAGVKDNGDGAAIVGDGGSAKRSVLMWLSWNFDTVWVHLIREMSLLKAGSFALCLLSVFFDKQLSLSSRDTLYLRIAFVCGLLAFFGSPWHVPDADATLWAQGRQEIAVSTLLMGVLTVMVTALDDQFRVPVLVSCLALIHIGRGLEED